MDKSLPAAKRPEAGAMFLTFGKIGLLSFGGGSTTLVLMEQEVVRRRGWLDNREFLFTMGLSRMWPGVHLLAQAVLIGHVLGGVRGGLICLLGMMVPATLVTVLFTAFFVVLRENPLGAGMIAGVLPATAGLSFAVAYRFARGEVAGGSRRAGTAIIAIAVGSFVMMGLLNVPSLLTVATAAILGALVFSRLRDR